MAAVKGSKQYSLRVVKYRPVRWWSLICLLLLAVVAAILVSFQLGFFKGLDEKEVALADVARMQTELDNRQNRIKELEQQLANIRVGAEVDRQSNEDVRQEVIALKEQLAQLEEDNSFYRNLMAPTQNKSGLTIGSVEIGDTDVARNYRYKVVMQQLATNHQLLNGTLKFTVFGKLNGFDASYELNELSSEVSEPIVRLRFKYFQNVEGRLVLPEGFEPERIELVARSTGGDAVTVEKRFGWLVEETSS